MSTPKRERSVNFSREEVELLTSLVAQHKNILENKKSDAIIWQEKEQCWRTLEDLFYSTSGFNFRSAKSLKAKYEGIKRATRKKSAAIRAETYRTGGGSSDAPPLTAIEEKVKDMILLSVEGIESQLDSDHIDSTQPILPSKESLIKSQNIELDNSQIILENIDIHTVAVDADLEHTKNQIADYNQRQNNDSDEERPPKRKIGECASATPKTIVNDRWANWKPKSLRSKKHPALSATKMKRPFERVADSKLEIQDLQKQILEEELINKRKQ